MTFRRLFIPTIRRGCASWCGRFVIISAPPVISQWFGRGEIGLEWLRWTERGNRHLFGWRA